MILYRYSKYCTNETLRDFDNKSCVKLQSEEFYVVNETDKGYWFIISGKKKWTSKTSKRRFAYPTKAEALENFIRRTKRSIAINNYNIDFAELALKEAEKIFN